MTNAGEPQALEFAVGVAAGSLLTEMMHMPTSGVADGTKILFTLFSLVTLGLYVVANEWPANP